MSFYGIVWEMISCLRRLIDISFASKTIRSFAHKNKYVQCLISAKKLCLSKTLCYTPKFQAPATSLDQTQASLGFTTLLARPNVS